jgi:hypothetical protein
MMLMADNDPLPISQVWELADALKSGQSFIMEWRTVANTSRTGQRWKEKRGVVLQTSTKGGVGKQRYASVQFDGMARPVMFPEDGLNGTHNLEYRCVELDEEVAFTASPEKTTAAQVPAGAQAPLLPSVPDPQQKSHPLNPRVRAMMEEARKEVEGEGGSAFHDSEDEDEEADISAETCLDPARWEELTKREMDVMRAQAWIKEYFAALTRTKSQAENIIFSDMIDVLCSDVASVRRCAIIVSNPEWLKARERTLARLLIQMERAEGASTTQLNALQRGFSNRKQPEWVRHARETGSHLLTHPDPFRSSRQSEGKAKGTKEPSKKT